MIKIAIATPTYNEATNIKKLIIGIDNICQQHQHLRFTLLVIDDSSPDGTTRVAQRAAGNIKSQNLKVEILNRKDKAGFDKAYVHGFNTLLKKDLDYIIQMDADLSHNPIYIHDFLKLAEEGKDFVIASRYIKGGGIPSWGIHRKLLSKGGNIYAKMLLSNKISDYTGGYNMFSKQLLKKVDPNSVGASGYGFLIELKYRALLNAKEFAQIPIVFTDRQHGFSKIPKNTLVKNLLLVPYLKFSLKKNK